VGGYTILSLDSWSDDNQRQAPKDHLYQIHPVVVLRSQPKGRVQIATITSTLKPTVDHRMYVPISAPHWNISEDRPRLSLVGTSQKTIELPKPHSYVKLDSRREVPFETLKEFTHDGSQYQLAKRSTTRLWNFVLQAEQGSSIEESHYWEIQNKVNAAISKLTKVRIYLELERERDELLQTLQQRDDGLANVVAEDMDLHWLHRQQDRFRELLEHEMLLQDATHSMGAVATDRKHQHIEDEVRKILTKIESQEYAAETARERKTEEIPRKKAKKAKKAKKGKEAKKLRAE
jgi:hypothetical protein